MDKNITNARSLKLKKEAFSEKVQTQAHFFQNNELFLKITETTPSGIIILNKHCRIVYVNEEFLNHIQLTSSPNLLGLHFGDVVNCIAVVNGGVCGASEVCQSCNVYFSITRAQNEQKNTQVSQIIRVIEGNEETLDLRVWSSSFVIENQKYIAVNVANIHEEKRRETLEDIFFHELVNNAGAIQSMLALQENGENYQSIVYDYGELLAQASRQLLDNIEAQRQLLAAERGDLSVVPMIVHSLSYFYEIMDSFDHDILLGNRKIRLDPKAIDIEFYSDRAILGRVLRYMVKNGLEGTPDGEVVTIGCDEQDGRVRFWVHYPVYLPPEDHALVFQRKVSITGIGRGVETYSMKLLGERYLQGEISFESDLENGSKFIAQYPKKLVLK